MDLQGGRHRPGEPAGFTRHPQIVRSTTGRWLKSAGQIGGLATPAGRPEPVLASPMGKDVVDRRYHARMIAALEL